jgi:hypothetical protein
MRQGSNKRIFAIRIILILACLLFGDLPDAWGQTFISGKVITSDGKIVASGVVALEKGELHNNAFLTGGAIGSDGTFKIPLPSGGPWGLHVYSEGYIYFPLQVQIKAGFCRLTEKKMMIRAFQTSVLIKFPIKFFKSK